MSLASWLILFLCFTPIFTFLLRPSLWEYCLMTAVDFLGLQMIILWERHFLVSTFPSLQPYAIDTMEPVLSAMGKKEKTAFFKLLCQFPARFGIYCVFSSILKGIPAFLIIVFYWKHEHSNLSQFLLFLGIVAILWSYFYGVVFIESHDYISKLILSLHEKYDWGEVFSSVDLQNSRIEFERPETTSFISVLVFTTCLDAALPTFYAGQTRTLTFAIVLVSLCCMVLLSRLWYLYRQYLMGSLEELFLNLASFTPSGGEKLIPLHSVELIGRFEQTFNLLVSKLKHYELELSHWVLHRAEQSRYQAMGEISSLLIHDLGGPLHVLRFCTEHLKTSKMEEFPPKYKEQLVQSSQEAVRLVESFRDFLRAPETSERDANLSEALESVFHILSVQFTESRLSSIRFEIDPNLKKSHAAFRRNELIHIFLNLLSNSVSNLLTHSIPSPRIAMNICEEDEEVLHLRIDDNGTGLSKKKFEELTGIYFPLDSSLTVKTGLGLRLTRRLIERFQGQLDVLETPGVGTSLLLTLPKSQRISEPATVEHPPLFLSKENTLKSLLT